MADTAVTGANVAFLAKNTALTTPSGQSVTTGNTAVLTPVAATLDGNGVGTAVAKPFKGRYMLIRLVSSAASTITFKAGVTGQTPANQAVAGDLVVTHGAAADQVIQVELSRFLQANGTVRAVVGGTGPVAFTVLNLSKGVA